MKELPPSVLSHIEKYTPEEQRERIKQAIRILKDWDRELSKARIEAYYDRPLEQSAITLVDKIIGIAADEYPDDTSEIKISDMNLSVGLANALIRRDFFKIGDLLSSNYQEIREKSNIGKARIAELERRLGELGITLPNKK